MNVSISDIEKCIDITSNTYNVDPNDIINVLKNTKEFGDVIKTYLSSQNINILTFNTFFDGPDYLNRINFVIKDSKERNIDILCLQEVLFNTYDGLDIYLTVKRLLILYGYNYVYVDDVTKIYGLVIASRTQSIDYTYITYDVSVMDRGFQHIRFKTNEKIINIINTHLESTFQFQSTRNKQLTQLKKYITSQNIQESVLVCGDFNMVYKDIFQFKGFLKQETDFITWYGNRYHETNKSSRFDKVYTGSRIKVQNIQKVMNKPIENHLEKLYPSDHDGILISLFIY